MINSMLSGTTSTAKACIHAGKRLQFQSNMLNHMSHPGAFFNTLKKTSFMIFAASVRLHARKHFFQSFQKAFNFVGWSLFQFFQIQLHYYKLMSAYAPKVWSPHGANFKYPHKKTIWLWHEYRKMNRILKKATSPKNKEAYSFPRKIRRPILFIE